VSKSKSEWARDRGDRSSGVKMEMSGGGGRDTVVRFVVLVVVVTVRNGHQQRVGQVA
jgi:hypothetical protein